MGGKDGIKWFLLVLFLKLIYIKNKYLLFLIKRLLRFFLKFENSGIYMLVSNIEVYTIYILFIYFSVIFFIGANDLLVK